MKKVFGLVIALSIAAFVLAGTQDVREIAKGWRVGNVAVSTTTVTTVVCGASTWYPGRYKIRIENYDPDYEVAIGTFSTITYAAGFVVGHSSFSYSVVDLPLQASATVYALGESNTVRGTIDVRCIEFK